MTEKDVHQLIEEQTPELKKLVYEHIREDAERSVTEGAKRRQRRKHLAIRLCSVAAAFVLVAVCLSVVLPIVLNDDPVEVRYSDEDITYLSAEFTLKEYSQQHGSEILYLDWYEDYYDTIKGCESSNLDNIVCIQENLVDPETGHSVILCTMAHSIVMDKFKEYDVAPSETTLNNNVVLNYKPNINQTMVKFEYGNYKYYLEFTDTSDMDYIRETIESMFKN